MGYQAFYVVLFRYHDSVAKRSTTESFLLLLVHYSDENFGSLHTGCHALRVLHKLQTVVYDRLPSTGRCLKAVFGVWVLQCAGEVPDTVSTVHKGEDT